MKKIFKLLPALLFFVIFPTFFSAQAAYLKFDKTAATAANGATFQISVMVEPGSDGLSSTDVYVTYDSTLLNATTVANGTQFPIVTNDTATAGKIYIAGMVSDPANSITAAGTLATITFQALKDGSGTLAFDCDTSKIIKNDINASNVIVCSQNVSASVTIGGGGGGTNPTPTTDPGTTDGSTTDNTDGTTDNTTAPAELPQSGIFDNVSKIAVPGMLLLLIGSIFRLLL